MSTTQTTASNGEDDCSTRSLAAAHWSDLPDDLLGNIRLRVAYQRDRVRLAAVCRSCHAALARIPAPPAIPLLLSPHSRFSGRKHLCSGGRDGCCLLPVPDKVADMWLVGWHDGGWVAAFDFDTRDLLLLNLFSHDQVLVSSKHIWGNLLNNTLTHVVFSDGPTSSSGCIIATITDNMQSIALCKVGCPSGWTKQGEEGKIFTGITFCNGDLYGLVYPGEELVKFEIATKEDGSPVIKSTQQLAIQMRHGPTVNDLNDPWVYECYIFELHGKPWKAVRTQWLPNHEPFFKVFEIINTDPGEVYQHKWAEVTSFGEYALFLGPARSKAVHVPDGSERHGFERNHIYYSMATRSRERNLRGDEVYWLRLDNDGIMYCREDQCIGDGLERTGYFMMGWVNAPIWLHPPEL